MKSIQYTVREIPKGVDHALRQRAARERKSLNAMTLQVLAIGLGVGEERPADHGLDALAGTWVEDPAFDAALREMDQVDRELWK